MCKSNRINTVRKKKGVSIRKLATELDMPVSTVEKYLYNVNQPDIFDIKKIAEALGVNIDQLIKEK